MFANLLKYLQDTYEISKIEPLQLLHSQHKLFRPPTKHINHYMAYPDLISF